MRTIEIMDTTLRDGEQTEGVSFSSFEKLQLTRFFLERLGVNRVEVASARVSDKEKDTVREIFDWAREHSYLERIEILGFVDGKRSVDWIASAGGRVLNLLTKGSQRHCEIQLGKGLKEHLKDIAETVLYAVSNQLRVHVYLEDWSNGYLYSPDYVFELFAALLDMPVQRFLLPDTLGIFSPQETTAGIDSLLQRHPNAAIDFHGHNDYGLAVANCLAAVQAGAQGVHVSVNGLGERAGNTPLEAAVTALHDKLKVKTSINEKAVMDASRLVETFSGKRIQANRPIVGHDVYTQTAGIHADGDKKANLYVNPILPERFGRTRVYALGKLAGKASISNNLKMLGIELSSEKKQMILERIKELGEKKKAVTPDDLPFLIEDMFGSGSQRNFKVKDAVTSTSLRGRAHAQIEVELKGKSYTSKAEGDGGYDAFMNALSKIMQDLKIVLPQLVDYEVRIPPGGKTDALVEAVITWQDKDKKQNQPSFRTAGVATDQVIAAVQATEKMLNRRLSPAYTNILKQGA